MNLYEISNDLKAIEEFIEIQGDDTQQSAVVLDAVKEALNTKADGVAKYIKNEEATIDAVDEEIKRLKELKNSKTKRLQSFKDYVITSLNIAGVKKVETSIGNVTVRNYPVLEVNCEINEIPEMYVKTETKEITTIDKVALKKAVKCGEEIKGIELADNFKINVK